MPEPRRTRIVPEVDFEKNGTQHGFLRLFHSTHASAYGFIPIPIVVIRNGSGPTAFFLSGNHGDEYEGQVALCNLAKWLTPESDKRRLEAQCLKRWLEPDDIARFCVFLASDEASACTAQHYVVDAGWV